MCLKVCGWVVHKQVFVEREAQYNLGLMYALGRGSEDDAEAVRWYRMAVEQGDADAQFSLGAMYAEGIGVPQNDAEAAKWYRKAAEQRHAWAQHNLGALYAKGSGVPQNHIEAVKFPCGALTCLTYRTTHTKVLRRTPGS